MDLSSVFLGLITWLPLCVWILCLVHWAVGGDIDVVVAIIGISIALVLGVVAVRPPIEILTPIACCTAYITVLVYPFVNAVLNRYEQKKLDVEEVESGYRALGQSPDNPLAKFKLAKAVYKNGFIGHAVAIADEAMTKVPRRVAEEEFRMLIKWKRIGVPPETLKPLTCIECHSLCQPGWTHCRNCGAQFLLHRIRGQVLPGGLAQRLIAIWGGAVLLIIGIPIAASFSTAPAIACSVGLVFLVAVLIFFTFRHRSGSVV
jgi:hypothetical protein